MSLNIISVTLNMDTVNFLGISIVGQSNKFGDGDCGIYVGSIMKGIIKTRCIEKIDAMHCTINLLRTYRESFFNNPQSTLTVVMLQEVLSLLMVGLNQVI